MRRTTLGAWRNSGESASAFWVKLAPPAPRLRIITHKKSEKNQDAAARIRKCAAQTDWAPETRTTIDRAEDAEAERDAAEGQIAACASRLRMLSQANVMVGGHAAGDGRRCATVGLGRGVAIGREAAAPTQT